MSQYAPFFYEHIYQGELVMLDEIEDTCQLEKTYRQLLSHRNRNPFAYRQCAVLLFIPRDFSLPLRPQDYELYNDINTYLHLLRNLDDNFKVYTFYVDRTGELEQNDAIYQQLNAVNSSLQANRPELRSHFLSVEDEDLQRQGDYKEFLCRRISLLSESTRPFYLHMLDRLPDMHGDATIFRNALNNFIGETRVCLSEVKHVYAPIYRLDLSKEIEQWLKIVYYIKEMIEKRLTPEQLPDYEHFVFDRYDHVRKLIATYCRRLSDWVHATPQISRTGTCTHWDFSMPATAAAEYHDKINSIIDHELASVSVGSVRNQSVVDGIFSQLNLIVTNAWGSLQDFAAKQSKYLLDPQNYQAAAEEEFDLEEPEREDLREEKLLLERLNQHSRDAARIPDFSAENRLEQELEQINHQINQILANLSVYRIGAFALTFLFAFLGVAGLYAGSHYSILAKENTWWIFGAYLAIIGVIFGAAYFTVRRRYMKEIGSLIGECKKKVGGFLRAFQQIAVDFEENTLTAGRYSCLKRELDERRKKQETYRNTMRKYAWHKMKADQILRNLSYFDSFVNHAPAYDEDSVTLDSYDHDPEHTEFYIMKVFRR